MSTTKGEKSAIITPAQIRAARALLDWSRERLAKESGVSARTLARIESEPSFHSKLATLELIHKTLAVNVKFIAENGDGHGVRIKRH